MTLSELWISGATDVFGYRFRDAWHVQGWEEGKVPERYVCWLPARLEPTLTVPGTTAAPQLDLFA
jgi:hypothetical protein